MSREIVPHTIPLVTVSCFPPGALDALAEFYQAVYASGEFSWIGIARATDEEKRLAFYLMGGINNPRDIRGMTSKRSHGTSIVESFDKLMAAFRPDFHADLYFACVVEFSPQSASSNLQEYFARHNKQAQVLWEQMLT